MRLRGGSVEDASGLDSLNVTVVDFSTKLDESELTQLDPRLFTEAPAFRVCVALGDKEDGS
jgi:hypothetical protein